MKNIKLPLIFTTYYLFVFVIFIAIEPLQRLAMFMFSLSPFVVIWMVYRVLKDGTPSNKTFETHFYEN